MKYFLRFILGGAIVSAFAVVGDVLKPKSFAGLFGAAPSVALATLGLTLRSQGPAYCAVETRSMIGGAIAFFVYACIVGAFMGRRHTRALQDDTSGYACMGSRRRVHLVNGIKIMKPYGVEIDPKGLRGTGWRDYALRFILGGIVTASAGIVAKLYGPVIGGFFLAFPAIFPASATLIEKHEIKKKAKAGFDGTIRGVKAASIDATGAAIGTIGLALFAVIVWKLLGHYSAWEVLATGTLVWLLSSVFGWFVMKRMRVRSMKG